MKKMVNGVIVDMTPEEISEKEQQERDWATYKAEYDAKEYQRLRKYPTIQDQLDMLYWDKVNNTNVWRDTIQAVKDQFPKSN